jgi:DNA-binding transcriptional regulator PaaX
MTDLPDEIVERVARAIYLSNNRRYGGKWDLVETKEVWLDAARASLIASGWGEMREALEKTANWLAAEDDHKKEPCFYRRVDMFKDAENAIPGG